MIYCRETQQSMIPHRAFRINEGKCIISIVPVFPPDYYKKRLGEGTFIVRVMPNTPILLGCGASAIATNTNTPQDLYDKAVSLFSSAGEVAFVDEEYMNAVTGVNGSSPAYFFMMAKAMADCAAEQGIDASTALRLAAKIDGRRRSHADEKRQNALMSYGSGKLPGGTTLAPLKKCEARFTRHKRRMLRAPNVLLK